MSKTRVVNLRREKYDVYIGRAGKGQTGYYGNPYTVEEHGDAALDMYRIHFYNRVLTDAAFRRRVLDLRGKILGCFCKPKQCHGDVIVQYLEPDHEKCVHGLAKSSTCIGCSKRLGRPAP